LFSKTPVLVNSIAIVGCMGFLKRKKLSEEEKKALKKKKTA